MELRLPTSSLQIADFRRVTLNHKFNTSFQENSSQFVLKLKQEASKAYKVSSALPETAASIAAAATIVGAVATLLVKRTKSSKESKALTKDCDDCGGSGICSECNGEGFMLKKLSGESAEKARMMAKNAATRYTAGLPKKWSYCTKCSSGRSCSSCGGTGKLILLDKL